MVRCMRNIFLSLSESSSVSSKVSASKLLPSSSSPLGPLSRSSLASFSDSSAVPSSMRSPSAGSSHSCLESDLEGSFDPYRVNGKGSWKSIGSYGLAEEICWMSIGKEQLEYASEALRKFRLEFFLLINFTFQHFRETFWCAQLFMLHYAYQHIGDFVRECMAF